MTRHSVAILGGAAMALALAGAAAAAENITSTGYVDSLQWRINHAADRGVINDNQRDRLLDLQQRTRDFAWRCDTTGEQFACQRTIRNVNYINQMIRGGGYGYGYGQRYYRNYDNDSSYGYYHNPTYGYGGHD